ncbi:hypothetical protein ACIGHN_12710 [Acidovorax sp. NPDC077693]|uniref:hypothetical protein n=1 Tax=unclassified Acidovorax TaxID=2684926 RepID=UPI0037C64D87
MHDCQKSGSATNHTFTAAQFPVCESCDNSVPESHRQGFITPEKTRAENLQAEVERRLEWTLSRLLDHAAGGVDHHNEAQFNLLAQFHGQLLLLDEKAREVGGPEHQEMLFARAAATFTLMNAALPGVAL